MNDNDRLAATTLAKHRNTLMDLPGVQGVAIGRGSDFGGSKAQCIIVYMTKKTGRSNIPKRLDGVDVHIAATHPFTTKK